jgi:hypothetical protein
MQKISVLFTVPWASRTATKLRARGPGFEYRSGKRFSSCPNGPDWLWGTPTLLLLGIWPGREGDHTLQSSNEIKNEWSLHGVDSDKYTFTFYGTMTSWD